MGHVNGQMEHGNENMTAGQRFYFQSCIEPDPEFTTSFNGGGSGGEGRGQIGSTEVTKEESTFTPSSGFAGPRCRHTCTHLLYNFAVKQWIL